MANIAIFRINYKSDFIMTLNSDAGWMTPFCIKFWTGSPSQAYFVGFDGTTYTHCAPVAGEPTKLLVQFDDHHLPIGDLKFQIGYHFTVEDFPTSVENEVINQASVIIEVDDTPAQVMLDFNGETAPEIQFSLPAYANEVARIENELQRQENELARQEAELQREQATAAAVEGAENVNAQLNGTILTVTNRNGVSTSKNVQGPQGIQGQQGETGATPVIEATASVDDNVGIPMVTVDSFGPAESRTFDFAFKNLKGAPGKDGAPGTTPDISASATIDSNVGIPSVTVSVTGTTEAPNMAFAFKNLKGQKGDTGAPGNYTKPESGIPLSDLDGNVASGIVYDVTANNSGATFASLSALLSSGSLSALIPTSVRKGGMQIRFVCSSDNKYVQFRYMPSDAATAATFTNTANWQGVDATPTENSHNLVESGGVAASINNLSQSVNLLSEQSLITNEKTNVGRYVIEENIKSVNSISAAGTTTIVYAGKNLLDASTLVDKKIKNDSGVDVLDAVSCYFTQMIPVYGGCKITSNIKIQRVYYYTTDKQWIGRASASNIYTQIIPATVSNQTVGWIQIQAQRSEVQGQSQIMVNYGESVLAYEAYKSNTEAPYPDYSLIYDSIALAELTVDATIVEKTSDVISTIEEALSKPLDGKTVVCFGDSITELKDTSGKSYTDYLASITGATVINVGIGGTMISQRTTPVLNPTNAMQGYAGLDIASMVLAACNEPFDSTHTYRDIATNAAEWVKDNQSDDNTAIVNRLLAIDWSTVNAVVVFGGTNDWHNNNNNFGTVTLSDKTPTYTCGAINLIIDKLLTTYPHLSLFWFTPIVRCCSDYFSQNTEYAIGDATIYQNNVYKFVNAHHGAWDANDVEAGSMLDFRRDKYFSDNWVIGTKTLKEFSESVMELVALNHIPVSDIYNSLGWNLYNFSQYFRNTDNTHPYLGFENLAARISADVIANKNF